MEMEHPGAAYIVNTPLLCCSAFTRQLLGHLTTQGMKMCTHRINLDAHCLLSRGWVWFAGVIDAYAARRSIDDTSSLVSALSGQPGQAPTAAQPLDYAAAHADKERRPPSMASPARSDRQRLIPAWKPMDEARPSSRSTGPSPRLGGAYLTCAVRTHLSLRASAVCTTAVSTNLVTLRAMCGW